MGGVGLNDLLLTAIEQGVYRSGARLNGDAVVINLSELSPLADAVTELPPALPRIVEGRVPSDCARTAGIRHVSLAPCEGGHSYGGTLAPESKNGASSTCSDSETRKAALHGLPCESIGLLRIGAILPREPIGTASD